MKITKDLFVEVYERYWKELYIVCSRLTNDSEISKEIIQELFISIWERKDQLQIHTSLRSYLHSALKLKILEHYRRQKVRDNYLSIKQGEVELAYHNTEEQVFHQDLNAALRVAVQDLPDRCRQVYLMSREEGMDNKSIAAALIITEKAVEGNITRALASIRKRLKIFNS